MSESVNLMPVLLTVEVTDDADEARYTYGEMWFPITRKVELLELAALKEPIASVKVMIHRRIYHLTEVQFDYRLTFEGTEYIKIKYSAGDLVSINEWTVPARTTK